MLWVGLQANTALESQIEAMQNEPSAFVAATEKKSELLADRDKFYQLVEGRTVSTSFSRDHNTYLSFLLSCNLCVGRLALCIGHKHLLDL